MHAENVNRKSRRMKRFGSCLVSRECFVIMFALLSLHGSNAVTAEDKVPAAVSRKTAVQMKPLVEQASAENMIISDIQVQANRTQQLFSCKFEKNTNNTAWLILLNLSGPELQKQQADLSAKGYFPVIERSVKFQGNELWTVVWHRKADDRPLVLPDGPLPESGLEDKRMAPLDELMRDFMKQHNAAGATLAVAKDGRLLYSRGFGYSDIEAKQPMQPDAVMRIASISKSITAVATLTLIADGKLSLDETILPHLKEKGFQLTRTGDQRWADITVRQLLQHTAGWDRDITPDPMFQIVNITRTKQLRSPANRKNILRYQLTQPLYFAPGERYAYSNFGYSVLAQVIEAVTDMRYEEFVKQRILDPYRMQQTQLGKTRFEDRIAGEVRYYEQTIRTHSPFWSVPEKAQRGPIPKIPAPVESPYGQWDLEVMDAHGGWVSSAPDLLRFVWAIETPEKPLLSEDRIAAMLNRPQLHTAAANEASWYGCGWNVRSIRPGTTVLEQHNFWHVGALAGTSTILVRRNDGFSWAVLFNTDKSINEKRLASLIDSPIHVAVNKITEWPDHDLFAKENSN